MIIELLYLTIQALINNPRMRKTDSNVSFTNLPEKQHEINKEMAS